jgi:hypothetical protein
MDAVYRIEHKYDKNETTKHYRGVFDYGVFEDLAEDVGLIHMPHANFDFYDLRDNVFAFLHASNIKDYIEIRLEKFAQKLEERGGCIRVYKVNPSRKDCVQCVFDPEDARVLFECLTAGDMITLIQEGGYRNDNDKLC